MNKALPTLAVALVGQLLAGTSALAQRPPEKLDCTRLDCASVLPEARRFEPVDGAVYVQGFDANDAPVGWVVLSTDVVDIKAYSSKPLVTLVGLKPDGTIAGARVVHHSEPILLVGIPESKLHAFVDFYTGKPATARIVVGRGASAGAISVDAISGATVTALAQNRTILDSARELGKAVGVIDTSTMASGHFVAAAQAWSWQRMLDEKAFGRLTVTEKQMGFTDHDGIFVDLWFTIADAPQVGRSILGDREYERLKTQLEPGQHLFVVFGNGSSSFKGSAFVRGGIFDRVRVEQGLTEVTFRDTDYTNLPRPRSEGAPSFKEGAVFVTRGGLLDPGAPYSLAFLGSRYDHRGAFTRDFREFSAEHELPRSVYLHDDAKDEAIWAAAWRNRKLDVAFLVVYLLLVSSIFAARRWTVQPKRILKLHLITMLFSFFMVGVYMKAQPSVTQILTLVDSLVHEWRWELFASEPLLFTMWIFIFITSIIWGRGVFCGWVCPYGTMNELVFKLGRKLHIPDFELPDRMHFSLRYLRYGILAVLIPLYIYDSVLAERMAEIEPFKSTFLVPAWTREWWFVSWWSILILASLAWYRPFCRYLCPLGAGLALFGSFRVSGPYRRNFCSSCTICTRGCEPRAIRSDGTIDSRECLSCMECEATYRDEERCPPLIGIARLEDKPNRTPHDEQKLVQLRLDREDVR